MKWLNKCLESLEKSDYPTSIIVVDNASSDGSQDFIRNNFPNVTLITSPDNLGFGRANNLGIDRALKAGADYYFLLNQDAFISPDVIYKLIDVHLRHDSFGILSPMHFAGDEIQLDYGFDALLKKFLSKDYQKIRRDCECKLYSIEFVNAACWLLSVHCIHKNGGFNPIFSHYGEDNEYTSRAHFKKLGVGIVSNTRIIHDRPQAKYLGSFKKMTDYEKIAFMKMATDLRDSSLVITIKTVWRLIRELAYNLLHFKLIRSLAVLSGYIQFAGKIPSIMKHRKLAGKSGSFLKA